MEARQKFSVCALRAERIWIEQMALDQRLLDYPEGSLPSILEKIYCAIDVLPMAQVEEGVLQMKRD